MINISIVPIANSFAYIRLRFTLLQRVMACISIRYPIRVVLMVMVSYLRNEFTAVKEGRCVTVRRALISDYIRLRFEDELSTITRAGGLFIRRRPYLVDQQICVGFVICMLMDECATRTIYGAAYGYQLSRLSVDTNLQCFYRFQADCAECFHVVPCQRSIVMFISFCRSYNEAVQRRMLLSAFTIILRVFVTYHANEGRTRICYVLQALIRYMIAARRVYTSKFRTVEQLLDSISAYSNFLVFVSVNEVWYSRTFSSTYSLLNYAKTNEEATSCIV